MYGRPQSSGRWITIVTEESLVQFPGLAKLCLTGCRQFFSFFFFFYLCITSILWYGKTCCCHRKSPELTLATVRVVSHRQTLGSRTKMSSNVEYEICLYFSFNCSVERFKSFSHQQRELKTFVTKIATIVTKGLKG